MLTDPFVLGVVLLPAMLGVIMGLRGHCWRSVWIGMALATLPTTLFLASQVIAAHRDEGLGSVLSSFAEGLRVAGPVAILASVTGGLGAILLRRVARRMRGALE